MTMRSSSEQETNKEIRIGSIYGHKGGSFAGLVFDKEGLAPSLNTMGGGNRQPMVIMTTVNDEND